MSKFGKELKKKYKNKLKCCVCYEKVKKPIYHKCFKRHFRKTMLKDFEKSTHHVMCLKCEKQQYAIMGESFRCPLCKEKWKSRNLYTEVDQVIYIDVKPPNQLENNGIETWTEETEWESDTETESYSDNDIKDPDWNENNIDKDWSVY